MLSRPICFLLCLTVVALAQANRQKRQILVPSFFKQMLREAEKAARADNKRMDKRTILMPSLLQKMLQDAQRAREYREGKRMIPSYIKELLDEESGKAKRTTLIPAFFQRLLKVQEELMKEQRNQRNRVKRDTVEPPAFLKKVMQFVEGNQNGEKRGVLSPLHQYNELMNEMQTLHKRGLVSSQLSVFSKLMDQMKGRSAEVIKKHI